MDVRLWVGWVGLSLCLSACLSVCLFGCVIRPVDADRAFTLHTQPQGWQQLLKRGVHTLRHPEFQLLVVLPGPVLSAAEREAYKEIDAIDIL